MKRPSWRAWGKWALLGVATGMAVMAMSSGEEHGQAGEGRAERPHDRRASSGADATIQRAAVATRVEFERLLEHKRQPDSGAEIGNAFSALSWYVPPPPPPPPPPQPPAAPVPPPLPFIFLGHFKNPDSPADIIILGWAERVYTVSEGEVIDGIYRVGPATDRQIEFTYLPLNIKQLLITSMTS